jgi:hypothetical protein
MTDERRDIELGVALMELPVPEHRDGFWQALLTDLEGSSVIADSAPDPTPDSTTVVLPPTAPHRRWLFSRRWAWAFATALLIIVAIGVVAGLQLFRGDPGPMIEGPVTTTTLPTTTTSAVTGTSTPGEAGPQPGGIAGPTFMAIDEGRFPSLIVGADGIPVIAYAADHLDERPLLVAACADPGCLGEPTISLVDTSTRDTYRAVMEPAPDGLPVYVWSEFAEGALPNIRLFKCADPQCTTGRLTELGSGDSPQLAVGHDNLPMVLYGTEGGSTTLVKCHDPDCGNSSRTTIDGLRAGPAGPPMIAAGPDSLPVIAVSRATTDTDGSRVSILRCSDPDCSGEILTTETGVAAQGIEELAVTGDSVPVILTVTAPPGDEQTPGDLTLIGCDGPECASPEVTTITGANGPLMLGEGRFGSMAVAPDDRVSIAFAAQATNGRVLTVATCTGPDCEGGVTYSPTTKVDQWVWLSLALNPAGYPVVAYNSSGSLNLMLCSDRNCTAPQFELPPTEPQGDWSYRLLDEGGAVREGLNPTVLVDTEGLPTVVYNTANGAAVVACNDPACESSTTTPLNNGGHASAALRSDGRAVVVAMTTEWDGVELTMCRSRSCREREVVRVAEGWVNGPPAVTVGLDGSIVVAYHHPDDWYVRVVTCLDDFCTETTEGKLESLADPGDGEFPTRYSPNSIKVSIGDDYLPVLAVAQTDGTLRAVKCTDPGCSESTTVVLSSTGAGGQTADMAIRADNHPIVAFYEDGELKVAACQDPGCFSFTVTSIEEAISGSYESPAIEVGPDGLALIAYWTPASEVRLARCLDELCTQSQLADVADLNIFDLAIAPDGSPVLAYYQPSSEGYDPMSGDGHDMVIARCNAGTCTRD